MKTTPAYIYATEVPIEAELFIFPPLFSFDVLSASFLIIPSSSNAAPP